MYFVVGNLWLLVAAIIFWGREYVGSVNDTSGYATWRLFGVGRIFFAYQYPWMLGVALCLAAVCFLVHWRSTRAPA